MLHRTQRHATQALIVEQQQLDRVSLVVVPDLVGIYAVPPAELALGKQEVDRRQRGPLNIAIEHLDSMRRAKHLRVVPTLRVRTHVEQLDQLSRARMHRGAHEGHSV